MNNEELDTMADAVSSIVEASIADTAVTGGSCGSWCADAHECEKWEEHWEESR